jgi:glycosyltransferase involved in cell wall biosynthesis
VGKLIFPGRGTVEGVWRPFLSRLPPGRIDVIPQFVPPPPEGEPAPKRPGRRLVVCVGTVYPRKRQVDLLRAVAMLANAPLDCALVGHMSALDAPGDEIIRSDPERFIVVGGQSPEAVHSWYRAADVFSLPSGDESMPIAPIEAAWHGLPIMLADLECYEGVWRHGANALIHPVGDAEMIAWYLNMVLQSAPIRNRLSKAARTVPLRFAEQRMGGLFDAALAETITTFQ